MTRLSLKYFLERFFQEGFSFRKVKHNIVAEVAGVQVLFNKQATWRQRQIITVIFIAQIFITSKSIEEKLTILSLLNIICIDRSIGKKVSILVSKLKFYCPSELIVSYSATFQVRRKRFMSVSIFIQAQNQNQTRW